MVTTQATAAQKTRAVRNLTEKVAQEAIDYARAARPAEEFTPDKFLEPDFVDDVFEYLLKEFPGLFVAHGADAVKAAVRHELGGQDPHWIRRHSPDRRRSLGQQALALFNGRNASEVARRLNVSRATVYRLLKQGR